MNDNPELLNENEDIVIEEQWFEQDPFSEEESVENGLSAETDELFEDDPFIDTAFNGIGYNPNRDPKTGQFTFGSTSPRISVQSGPLRNEFDSNGTKTLAGEGEINDFVFTHHKGHPGWDTTEALQAWVTVDGCIEVQNTIRGESETKGYEKTVQDLDAATNSNSLNADANLYRGMATTRADLQEIARNGGFKTETFFTTGLNARRVEEHFAGHSAGYDTDLKDFRKPTMFRIKAKAGTKGVFVDARWPDANYGSGLGEFIPSRDTVYAVKDVKFLTNDNGDYVGGVVDLEIN